MIFVVARTAKGRPTLMHVAGLPATIAACGVDMGYWSRAYFEQAIPQILCKRCAKFTGQSNELR